MSYRKLVDYVLVHCGLADEAQAENVVQATFQGLAKFFRDVPWIIQELPPPLASAMQETPGTVDEPSLDRDDLDSLYQRVARAGGQTPSIAVEHTQIVCRAFATLGDRELLAHLRNGLPAEIAGLFGLLPVTDRAQRFIGRAQHGHSLATGRPGSSHPLSESRPRPGQEKSLANAENPHGDSKLSSGHVHDPADGGESLAAGRPGSTRPLTDSH